MSENLSNPEQTTKEKFNSLERMAFLGAEGKAEIRTWEKENGIATKGEEKDTLKLGEGSLTDGQHQDVLRRIDEWAKKAEGEEAKALAKAMKESAEAKHRYLEMTEDQVARDDPNLERDSSEFRDAVAEAMLLDLKDLAGVRVVDYLKSKKLTYVESAINIVVIENGGATDVDSGLMEYFETGEPRSKAIFTTASANNMVTDEITYDHELGHAIHTFQDTDAQFVRSRKRGRDELPSNIVRWNFELGSEVLMYFDEGMETEEMLERLETSTCYRRLSRTPGWQLGKKTAQNREKFREIVVEAAEAALDLREVYEEEALEKDLDPNDVVTSMLGNFTLLDWPVIAKVAKRYRD